MKYNKSEIMKRAHQIVRESGANQSTALRMAWIEAKIEKVSNDIFYLDMKDLWSSRDRQTAYQMKNERALLQYLLQKCQSAA